MRRLFLAAALILAVGCGQLGPAHAANPAPHSGMVTIQTDHEFLRFSRIFRRSIETNSMIIVGVGCASCGARSLGVNMPGNQVYMFFNRFFATQVLNISAEAGIEAPIRVYLRENPETGKAIINYRKPSHVFGEYDIPALKTVGEHLDQAVDKIIADANARAAAS